MIIQNNYYVNESTSILENATYLSEYESTISPYSIPIVENTRLGTNIVNYEDIERLCEEYGWSISKAMNKIANSNHTDNLTISVPEDRILEDASIMEEVSGMSYVVQPVSESNIVSQYVDYCVASFLESGDEEYIELCVNPEFLLEADEPSYYDKQSAAWDSAKKSHESIMSKGGTAFSGKMEDNNFRELGTLKPDKPGFLVRLKRFLTDKPRNFIAKVAARLKSTYQNFLNKANKEKDNGKLKWYKNIARIILKGVNWCLSKLENLHVDYDARTNKALGKAAEKAGYKNISAVNFNTDKGVDSQNPYAAYKNS